MAACSPSATMAPASTKPTCPLSSTASIARRRPVRRLARVSASRSSARSPTATAARSAPNPLRAAARSCGSSCPFPRAPARLADAARPADAARSADPARAAEGLVPEMVVLAGEGLEGAELVGVARSPGLDLDIEVTAQPGEVALERGDLQGSALGASVDAVQDLLHGQEPAVFAQDRVDRVVGDP